ncbi:MAG: agmatine deiminase family protein, partial [Verrucomicrobiae bacterium]
MSTTPNGQGYAMPAEWEPHEATWLSWPQPGCNSFPGSHDRVLPTFVEMVRALAASEIVRINVRDAAQENSVRKLLAGAPPERVEYFHIPTNEPWCRDHGPIFVRRKNAPQLAVLDFEFNAWGWKLSPFEDDDDVPKKIAAQLGLPVFDCNGFVLEGGSIDVNGAGTVLTTESCLLNPNRNAKLNRHQIEKKLRDSLGIHHVLWLGDGIEGDDTDGHVDDLARFIARSVVLTVTEEDESDPNFEPLRTNLDRLHEMRLPDGEPLHVLTLPMPARIVREGIRLPASYA